MKKTGKRQYSKKTGHLKNSGVVGNSGKNLKIKENIVIFTKTGNLKNSGVVGHSWKKSTKSGQTFLFKENGTFKKSGVVGNCGKTSKNLEKQYSKKNGIFENPRISHMSHFPGSHLECYLDVLFFPDFSDFPFFPGVMLLKRSWHSGVEYQRRTPWMALLRLIHLIR